MRISDWSSDVCSSDLPPGGERARAGRDGDVRLAPEDFDRGLDVIPRIRVVLQLDRSAGSGRRTGPRTTARGSYAVARSRLPTALRGGDGEGRSEEDGGGEGGVSRGGWRWGRYA